MFPPALTFTAMTLGPGLCLALGAVTGGTALWVGLLAMTAMTALLDEVSARTLPDDDPREFPAGTALSVALAGLHVVVLALAVRGIAGHASLSGVERAALFAGAGLFMGQVGNATAHELIHRTGRGLHGLGVWVYASLLFGHHASAHPLVHHVRVATRDDPATARRGESFYRYARRAWIGGFREGARAESARLARTGRGRHRHPYILYGLAAAAMLALSGAIWGWTGLAAHVGLAAFAQLQLLMSDYVQHYGLTRAAGPAGRPAPVGPQHSWNSPHAASSALMLNAPRHSDHHASPARPYHALRLPGADVAPMLPRSLPVMSCLALHPRGWRRVMDHRADAWADTMADPPRTAP